MKKYCLCLFIAVLFISCKHELPKTSGDPLNATGYGYQPLDALPVDVKMGVPNIDPLTKHTEVLNALSDETIRLAVGEIDGSSTVSYGPAKIGYKGHNYEVIIDYMKFQTYPKMFRYVQNGSSYKIYNLIETLNETGVSTRGVNSGVTPLYIGIGLRLRATVTVNEGSVDLGNLFSVGAAAQAKNVSGTLVVQTLGISGDKISGLLPMPSEISPTSIQNAVMALATIKSKIYDADTKITPRTLGFYNSLGGGKDVVNGMIKNCLQGNAILQLQP